MTKESCLSSVWKRRRENFTCVVIKLLPFLLHCPPSLDIYRHDPGSLSKNDLSHFFLSPAVNQWINKRVKHETCQPPSSVDWANLIEACIFYDKTETNRQKANSSSTNYKHSCLKRLVLFDKPFCYILGKLLSFHPLLVPTCLSIDGEVSEKEKKNI